ncbi:MAG: DNA repair protein RecO [Bdellovibrionaceae bacterium]|nr:DNA repair protein RecO [Pseudobdellovibrionaceae bacterium]
MQVKDRVFILKKVRYGDADLILHVLNAQGARLNLFARSALKSKKRFGGGVLEPTHFVSVIYEDRQGKAQGEGSLHTLKEASLIEAFDLLRTDYSRLEAALQFVQLVHDVSHEGEVHAGEIFNLLGNALKAAETTADLEKLKIHFEVKVLAHHGVLPVDADAAALLRAPIVAHDSIELDDFGWRAVSVQANRVLKEYLGKLS